MQSSKIYLGVSANAKVSNLITAPKNLSISEKKKLQSFEIYLGVVQMSNVWNLTVVSKRLEFPQLTTHKQTEGKLEFFLSAQLCQGLAWVHDGLWPLFLPIGQPCNKLGVGHPPAHPELVNWHSVGQAPWMVSGQQTFVLGLYPSSRTNHGG